MTSRKNNWREKRVLAYYDGHNRAAGVSAGNRAKRNKRQRRAGTAAMQNILRHYVPFVFKQ